jgi:dihydrofolate reductase
MRKLVSTTFVSMDSVMQAPGGLTEDESGGFTSGGWLVPYFDDVVGQAMGEIFARQPELLLGRKTYDIMVTYWPKASAEEGADAMNNAKKYVVSNTLNKLEWNNSTLIKGDAVNEIRKLKAQDGPELQVHGSGNLIQTLLKHNLIDEMHLLIFPVMIGYGKRLFGEGTHPASFKLVESKSSGSGVIIATYAFDGDLKTGALPSPE